MIECTIDMFTHSAQDLVDIHTDIRAKYEHSHYIGNKRISHDVNCLRELKTKPKRKDKKQWNT